jgi:hypothetical protein
MVAKNPQEGQISPIITKAVSCTVFHSGSFHDDEERLLTLLKGE